MRGGDGRAMGNRQINLHFNRPVREERGRLLSVAWQTMAHPTHLPQSSIGEETNAASRTIESESYADVGV